MSDSNNVTNEQVVEYFRSKYPEFQELEDGRIEDLIDPVQTEHINTQLWFKAGKLTAGLAAGVAHELAKQYRRLGSEAGFTMVGAVTSVSEDGQSASTSGPSGQPDSDLDSTIYGQKLKAMRKSIPSTPAV